ncbi:uncharacterized protein [Ptychodera flava]|uniref:uncharacterized protein n=1 Tax=Ptychodera flava TaxID=63121 RepID=UPI00396A43EC
MQPATEFLSVIANGANKRTQVSGIAGEAPKGDKLRRQTMTKSEPTAPRTGDTDRKVMHDGNQRRLRRKMLEKWIVTRRCVLMNEYGYSNGRVMDEKLNIPSDPMEWSPDDVITWLRHMAVQCQITDIPYEYFQMNGRGLCIMPTEGLLRRVPGKGILLKRDLYRRINNSRLGLNLKKTKSSL